MERAQIDHKTSKQPIALIASIAVILAALVAIICVVVVPKLSGSKNSGTRATSEKSEISEEEITAEEKKQDTDDSDNSETASLYQMITETKNTYQDGTEDGYTQIYQYNDKGLLSSLSVRSDEDSSEKGTIYYEYDYDENGYPVRMWIPYEGDENETTIYTMPIDIKNVIENGSIREAVLSFSDWIKESMSDYEDNIEDIIEESTVLSTLCRNIMDSLKNGTMYENAVIRFDFSDSLKIENKNGMTVLHSYYVSNIISQIEYNSDGQVISTMYIDPETGEISAHVLYSYDAEGRLSSSTNGDEELEYEYTESQESETGNTILSCESDGGARKYYYSPDGVLLRVEQVGSNSKYITSYNKNGQVESTESYSNSEDFSYSYVTLYIRSADDSRVEDISDLKVISTTKLDKKTFDSLYSSEQVEDASSSAQ